jgi:hypothetical protein
MPALPILCSGCLWAGYRADSAGCEVSLKCTFVYLFLLPFVVLVSLYSCYCCCWMAWFMWLRSGGSSLHGVLAWFKC